MVRKITGILAVMLLLLCGAAATASAESVYQGTISSTILDIAEKINISAGDDYVFFRNDQYSYTLLVGDLEYSCTLFTLVDNGTVYEISQVSGSGYTSQHYRYSVTEVSAYTVQTNGILVYSNLGGYPTLNGSGETYTYVCMILLCVIGLCALIRPLFNFVLRFRR